MARIDSLGKDTCVLTVNARTRLTFRRGALEMLVNPRPDLRPHRVPLKRGRDEEGGDLALNKTGGLLLVNVYEPPRRFLCKIAHARAFLAGGASALQLIDVSGEPGDDRPAKDRAAGPEAAARLRDLAKRMEARFRDGPGRE